MARHIMTLTCDDRPGIVAAVSAALLDVNANILENQQYSDEDTNLFFMRTVFDADAADVQPVLDAIDASAAVKHQHLAVRPAEERCRTLILVSKFDHCLLDLLYRWKSGDLPIDIVGVVSNHEDTRGLVEYYGLPFLYIPVTEGTKADAEARLLKIVEAEDVGLVVLARYMQILSDALCGALAGRAINIHHSFLPGFKGAKPYHQAHDRGVKLIGASAHYVTADLDEGPIIEQDVVRVTHAETPQRLVAIGRDVERRVLSRAVRDHAESRVFLSGRRTIVF
jgi:formyltetrahydrofolate deformylase